ncbi:hypothetical protein FRC07_014051, partial [Ceratobasidium sp. 392]
KPLSHSSSIHANPAASSAKMRARFGIQLDSEPSMVTPSLDHFVAYALHRTVRRSLGGAARSLATTAMRSALTTSRTTATSLTTSLAGASRGRATRRQIEPSQGRRQRGYGTEALGYGLWRLSTADAATGGPTADSSVVK